MKKLEDYPKDTIGYHRKFCVALFGADSNAVKFLDDKASESPNGLNERVIVHETQMVQLLGRIHFGG